jgi:hypothetical protein
LCYNIIIKGNKKTIREGETKMKKEFIKNNNLTGMVRELVEGLGMNSADAIEYVYDMKTMSNEEFVKKYLK